MSDYKRFVSYIYGYEQGEKRESAGFVKVNARGNECKFWVHVNEDRIAAEESCRVYVFMRRKERLQGQYLGELEKRNGAWEWSGVTETDSLMGGSFGLAESGGVYLEGDNRVFAAAWDDLPVPADRFDPEERFARQAVEKPAGESEVQAAELALEEERQEAEETGVGSSVQEEGASVQEETAAEEQTAPVPADPRKEHWTYLTKRFPVTRYVEGNGAEVYSIRLNNRDLSRIPRDKWELGNNSFLLHGYYQYGHLLLLRRQTEEDICYYIGVPGVYNEREQEIASMFGFDEFKVVKGPNTRQKGFAGR